MRTVLVTSGAGFIGSHLCERLLQEGHEAFCVDNYYTGMKENIAGLLSGPEFKPIHHDVVFPLHLEVDEIYNLACAASQVHYQRHPIQTTKTTVRGAGNILDLAARLGAKVLQTSTSEVYGAPSFIRRTRTTGEMSTRSAAGLVMMKASVTQKPYSSTITESTPQMSASHGIA